MIEITNEQELSFLDCQNSNPQQGVSETQNKYESSSSIKVCGDK